jgi:hypothetical protein
MLVQNEYLKSVRPLSEVLSQKALNLNKSVALQR